MGEYIQYRREVLNGRSHITNWTGNLPLLQTRSVFYPLVILARLHFQMHCDNREARPLVSSLDSYISIGQSIY